MRSYGTIIKGLSCCTAGRGEANCIGCPYAFEESEDCTQDLMQDAKEAMAYMAGKIQQYRSKQAQTAQNQEQRTAATAEKKPGNRSHEALMQGLMNGSITQEEFNREWNGPRG